MKPSFAATVAGVLLTAATATASWAADNCDVDPPDLCDALTEMVSGVLDLGDELSQYSADENAGTALWLYQARCLDEALAMQDRVVALWPNMVEAYGYRALYRVAAGRIEAAEEDLDAILAQDPGSPAMNLARGALSVVRGDYALAAHDFHAFRAQNNTVGYNLWIKTLFEGGDMGGLVFHLPDMSPAPPDYTEPAIRAYLGLSLLFMGATDKAVDAVLDDVDTYSGIGSAASSIALGVRDQVNGDWSAAIEAYACAVRQDPSDLTASVLLAAAVERQGGDGREALEEARDAAPRFEQFSDTLPDAIATIDAIVDTATAMTGQSNLYDLLGSDAEYRTTPRSTFLLYLAAAHFQGAGEPTFAAPFLLLTRGTPSAGAAIVSALAARETPEAASLVARELGINP